MIKKYEDIGLFTKPKNKLTTPSLSFGAGKIPQNKTTGLGLSYSNKPSMFNTSDYDPDQTIDNPSRISTAGLSNESYSNVIDAKQAGNGVLGLNTPRTLTTLKGANNPYGGQLGVSLGNQTRQEANGAINQIEQLKAIGADTGVQQKEAFGANSGEPRIAGANSTTSGGNSPFKLKTSFDDLTKGVKGSGFGLGDLASIAVGGLGLINRGKGINLKQTQLQVNPATGEPYETLSQKSSAIDRGLTGLSRNKSTDIMTNAATMGMAQANANQARNEIMASNAQTYLKNKERMTGEINANILRNDEFYNEAERMRGQADAINKDNQNKFAADVVNKINTIRYDNNEIANRKKEALLPVYQKMAQAQFEKEHGADVQAGIDAANEMQKLQGEVATFKQLDMSNTTDKNSAAYLEAKKKAELAESTLTTKKEEYAQKIKTRDMLKSQYDNALNQQFVKQIKGEKGLLFKKGGSLSVAEKKDLKEHEYSLKQQLSEVKERAKQAKEQAKELKKQELEFRKELAKHHSNNSKIISNFYKSNKK